MTTLAKKEELLNWISTIEDRDIINQLFDFKNLKQQNFDDAIKNALSAQQVKEETTTYIKSLDWKK